MNTNYTDTLYVGLLKGEVRHLFFIGSKLRKVSIGNFHRKAPKWVKNQVKGSKIDQMAVQHPTY